MPGSSWHMKTCLINFFSKWVTCGYFITRWIPRQVSKMLVSDCYWSSATWLMWFSKQSNQSQRVNVEYILIRRGVTETGIANDASCCQLLPFLRNCVDIEAIVYIRAEPAVVKMRVNYLSDPCRLQLHTNYEYMIHSIWYPVKEENLKYRKNWYPWYHLHKKLLRTYITCYKTYVYSWREILAH